MPKRIYTKTVTANDIANAKIVLEDDAIPFAVVLNSLGTTAEIFFYIVE